MRNSKKVRLLTALVLILSLVCQPVLSISDFTGNGRTSSAVTAKAAEATTTQNLKAPLVRVSDKTKTTITLKWNKVAGATHYRVHRSTDGRNWVTSAKRTSRSYTHKNLSPGKRYYYKVTAYKFVNGKMVAKKASSVKKAATRLKGGEIKSIKRSGSKIYVKWGGFSKAQRYKVYVSTDGGFSYKVKYSGKSTSFTLKNVSSKKTYYFKVKGYAEIGGASTSSYFCSRKRTMATSGNNFKILKLDKQRFINNLKSHEDDKYYLTTPYVYLSHTYSQSNMMRANGVKSSKPKGMNCSGFVARAIVDAGGTIEPIKNMGSRGGAGNAYNWRRFVESNGLKKYTYRSMSSLVKAGRARKGDIIIRIPDSYCEDPIRDYHVAIFWGCKGTENKVWHSTMEYGKATNKISRLPDVSYGCTYYLVKLSR